MGTTGRDEEGLAPAPRVSLGLPVFNGERYLRASAESVLAQTYTDLELILADNASTDGSLAICEELAARDPRVRLLRSDTNRGASWNFNRTVAEARGELFKWVASDDLHEPTYLQRCVDALDADPEVVLAHSLTVEIDEHGAVVDRDHLTLELDRPSPVARFSELVAHNHMCFPVFGLMRVDALRQTSLLGAYSDSDRVLLAELGLRGRFATVPEPLFLNREHPQRSVRAYPRSRERVAWFDPSRRGTVSFPAWRQGYEFVRAVARAPVPAGVKGRSLLELRRWLRLSWPWLVRNVVRSAASAADELLAPARRRLPGRRRRPAA